MATETPKNTCLMCGYKSDRASTAEGPEKQPVAGNLSVCMMCGAVTKFTADLRTEPLTDEEADEVAGNADLMKQLGRVTSAIRIMRQVHGRRN